MNALRIRTPSRLHFGLLAWNPASARQFGGVGLMIDAPGLELTAQPGSLWQAEGPLARRVLQAAERVAEHLAREGSAPATLRFRVHRAPSEHVGLGVGTQLGLAVARLLAEAAGRHETDVAALAAFSDRGARSGVGLHGFAHGGLIVDGGRRTGEETGVPPLLARLAWPPEWSVLVVVPDARPSLHGANEQRAFAELPPIAEGVTDRLCRLVLLGLLPAVVERDLEHFGAALSELQRLVGECFAPAQGGLFARPELEAIVSYLRSEGLSGVGQSSWGPTLYAFSNEPAERRTVLIERLRSRFSLDPGAAFWTTGNNAGAVMTKEAIEL